AWVVGHHKGRPSLNQATTGDDTIARQVVGHRIGELDVLDEGAIVEQQVDTLTYEELVRACQLGGCPFGGSQGTVARGADLVHDRLLHRESEPPSHQLL